jgi:hypothetical protein
MFCSRTDRCWVSNQLPSGGRAFWGACRPRVFAVDSTSSAAIALAALALHLATLGGRGVFTVTTAAGLVILILLVTFDLDRPTRGLIRVPVSPLVQARAAMVPPPAASAPSH